MGVVYHANYLVWFEVGRGSFFREIGHDYGEWEKQGYLLPVSEAHVRYHSPARYGEEITVDTKVHQVKSRSITLDYRVRRTTNDELLATGWTKHICMNPQGRACRLPGTLMHTLEASLGGAHSSHAG